MSLMVHNSAENVLSILTFRKFEQISVRLLWPFPVYCYGLRIL